MNLNLACIVEGHGDLDAIPVLVRRIASEIASPVRVNIAHRFRIPRSKLVKERELERAVELAARRTGTGGAVLIVLDSDDDCPAQLGPALLTRARIARMDFEVSVVVAHREFEAWFLAAAESLRGYRGLSENLSRPPEVETIRGTKDWLSNHMAKSRRYSETLDQPALAAVVDLTAAKQNSPSFARFYREVSRLLAVGVG